MTDIKKELKNHVESVKERVNNLKNPRDLNPLDVSLNVGLQGEIRDIELTMTTGEPVIEIKLGNSRIKGYWGNKKYMTSFNDEKAEQLWNYYEGMTDF